MHVCVYTRTHLCRAQDLEEETKYTWGKGAGEKDRVTQGSVEVTGRRKQPLSQVQAQFSAAAQRGLPVGRLSERSRQ